MKKLLSKFVLAISTITLALAPFSVNAISIPPSVDEYFYDEADVITLSTENHISEMNHRMDNHAGAYIEVVTVDYINADILDYSMKMFEEWRIGSHRDNGVLFLIVVQEEKYYVTVGTDLENVLDSYTLEVIFEESFDPYFDAGEYDIAIKNAFDRMYAKLVVHYGTPTNITPTFSSDYDNSYDYEFLGVFIIIGLILICAVIISSMDQGGRRSGFYHSPHTYYRPRRNSFWTSSRVNRPSSGWSSSSSFGSSSSSSSRSYRSGSSSSSSRSSSSSSRSSGGSSRGSGFGRR